MSARTFTTKLVEEGGVEVPFDVEKVFGKKRLPIKVTVNGVTYASTVAVYAGRYFFPMRREIREKAGVEANGRVTVTVEPDATKRTVKAPADLAKAIAKSEKAKKVWAGFSFTHRKEMVQWVTGAKKAETRKSRVEKAIAMMVKK